MRLSLLLGVASTLTIVSPFKPALALTLTLQTQLAMPEDASMVKEGYIPFPYQGETHQTYYKVFGNLESRTRTPVIVLHGGPGLSHDYLLPHADLANQSYPVVFYDQIGNSRSTHLPDKPSDFWSIDLFLDEFENVVQHLGIQDGYHIVGHSWGGMMAADMIIRRGPKGLKRLVIADSPAALSLWQQSFRELLAKFPQSVQDAVKKGYEDREGLWKAMQEIYAVHGCRIQPPPKELVHSLLLSYGEGADRTVDKSPILTGWTVVDRLHEINVPTLVINGRYDIAQDFVTRPFAENIPGAKWITFDNSSHTPFWEEREKYMQAVADFLGA